MWWTLNRDGGSVTAGKSLLSPPLPPAAATSTPLPSLREPEFSSASLGSPIYPRGANRRAGLCFRTGY